MLKETVNNAWLKGNQNYIDKNNYGFSKADKEMSFFSALSQIVIKIINLLVLNIKSLDL